MGALARACHPLPCAAVTAIFTVTALAAGLHGRVGLLATAVLCGQLSVGWSNDVIDAARDTRAGRTDKPIATAAIGRATVAWCAGGALLIDLPLSLSLGIRPGLLHLAAVALAWGYNLGLKGTWLSVVPYAVAFGLVPTIVAAMLPGSPWPQASLILAGAILGVAAHFANTLGDTAADELTGVHGLPQRIGPTRSAVVAASCVAIGALLVLAAAGATVLTVTATVIGVMIAATIPFVIRREEGAHAAFVLVIAAVGVLVVAFAISGGSHLVG